MTNYKFTKRLLAIIIVIIIGCLPSKLFAQDDLQLVLQEDAFERVCDIFSGQDVDIYNAIRNDGIESDEWIFFIDAEPLAYWEHQCYIIKYVKSHPIGANNLYELESFQCPPTQYNYEPLLVKDRESDVPEIDIVPVKPKDKTLITTQKEMAKHTFAVIIGGLPNTNEDVESFVPNCRKFYNMLVKTCYVPRENIKTMIYSTLLPGYVQDLDNDGTYDIEKYRGRDIFIETLDTMYNKMQENEHLVVFINGHGYENGGGINLLGILYPLLLKNALAKFENKNIAISLIIESCYSGEFAKKLNLNNCVIATSSDNTVSYRGVFITPFTKAFELAHNPLVDIDNDGIISIKEAFDYAYKKVIEWNKGNPSSKQTPQLFSNPGSLADVLSINRLPYWLNINGSFSVTNAQDENMAISWNSPDIWIRLHNDKLTDPQNIDASTAITATINTRIHNTGKTAYQSGKTLRLYWNQACTNTPINIWNGEGTYHDEPLGGHIVDIELKDIPAQKDNIFTFNWALPVDFANNENRPKTHQFNISGMIIDNSKLSESPVFAETTIEVHASSSISTIQKEDSIRAATVFFYNSSENTQNYNMYLRCRDDNSLNIYKYANVILDLDPTLYNSWTRGGSQRGGGLAPGYVSPYSLELLEAESSLKNITMTGRGIGRVSVIFDFFETPDRTEHYTFDLLQTDKDNNVLGGHTIRLNTPSKTFTPIPLDSICWNDGGIGTINPQNVEDFANAKWYNSKNQRVSIQPTLTVTPQLYNDLYKIVSISADGEMSSSEISIYPEFGIKSVSPNGFISNALTIEIHSADISGYNLTVASLIDGDIMYSKDLASDEKSIYIDCSSYRSGVYALICTMNGEIINTYKLIKQ